MRSTNLAQRGAPTLAMSPQQLATAAAIVAAGLLLPTVLTAQRQPIALQPGDQVRITAPSQNLTRQRGTLLEKRADTLVVGLAVGGALTEPRSRLLVPFGAITQLDVSVGRKGHLPQGLLLGSVGGGSIGALAGTQVDCSGYEQGLCMAYLGAIGAGVGAILGGVIGAAIRTERWTEVRIDRARLSIGAVSEYRLGLGLAFPF